jgi:hypothetical protein
MRRVAIALAMISTAGGCQAADTETFRLYRNSALDPDMRVHVATFDSREGEKFNRQNCDIVRRLFATQPGITVRYWCENGDRDL